MTLLFIPPKEDAKGLPRYASYVVGDGMKTHGSIGAAKHSFNYRGYAGYRGKTKHSFILENVNGKWYILYEIAEGLKSDELPWVKEFIRDTKYYWDNGQLLEDFNSSEYRRKLREEDPARFKTFKKSVPLSKEEYVKFRLAVQLEELKEND